MSSWNCVWAWFHNYDTFKRQQGRKKIVLLSCEQSGQYKKYKHEVNVNIIGSRKRGYLFKLKRQTYFKTEMIGC